MLAYQRSVKPTAVLVLFILVSCTSQEIGAATIVTDVAEYVESFFEGFYESLQSFITGLRPLLVSMFGGSLDIDYILFKPEDKKDGCLLGRTRESLESCTIDANLQTKIFLRGYNIVLKNTSVYYDIKDQLLAVSQFNIMIVNFTDYSLPPFFLGLILNAIFVGNDVAEEMKFLIEETGVNASSFHLIGQSLGAHVAGFAGKNLPDIGRITGLDPASPYYDTITKFNRLADTDAIFVDVIHTSDIYSGFGIYRPIGDQDYYVNGGIKQPSCEYGDNFHYTDGTNVTVDNFVDQKSCMHDSANVYFLESMTCDFPATLCDSYEAYEQGACESPVSNMGMFATQLPALPPYSKFYVDTKDKKPFCPTA